MPSRIRKPNRRCRNVRRGRTELLILTVIVTILFLLYFFAEISTPVDRGASTLGLGITLEDLLVRIVLIIVAMCVSVRMFAAER